MFQIGFAGSEPNSGVPFSYSFLRDQELHPMHLLRPFSPVRRKWLAHCRPGEAGHCMFPFGGRYQPFNDEDKGMMAKVLFA
jgi:hypothetical protein